MRFMSTLPIEIGRSRGHGFRYLALDLERRRSGDRSRLMFVPLQGGLRDIVTPSPSAHGRCTEGQACLP